MEQPNDGIWHWISSGILAAALAAYGFIFKTMNARIARCENMAIDLAGLKATVSAVHEIVKTREGQAHEGYQRLSRLEALVEENTKLTKEVRDEMRDLRKNQ